MIIQPNEFYRRAFKRGMRGWDVATIQISLNAHRGESLEVDGIFGAQTEDVVRQVQRSRSLVEDGICGVNTMRAMVVYESSRAERTHGLPAGLLKGIAEGESGYVIPATTSRYGNGTRDMGPFQFNTPEGDQTRIVFAFDCRRTANQSALTLRATYDGFLGKPGAKTQRQAWELAILNHNWPAAASRLAAGTFDGWRYTATNEYGERQTYGVDDPAYWIRRIGVAGVDTAREWVAHYVESKAIYVEDWTV